jgi:hypothetical protein
MTAAACRAGLAPAAAVEYTFRLGKVDSLPCNRYQCILQPGRFAGLFRAKVDMPRAPSSPFAARGAGAACV